MKIRKATLIILFVIIAMGWACRVLSFEKRMHQAINEDIAQRTVSDFSLNDYLISQLGFLEGVREILSVDYPGRRIYQWLGVGGVEEDNPEGWLRYPTNLARNNNHFHNPLADTWSSAGFDFDISPPNFPYDYHVKGQSSILWAHSRNQSLGGNWSWHDARRYYYEGLTLTDKDERERSLANCFRAVGQLMHLVQDASVPAHTRNEPHLIPFHYEPWLEKIRQEEPARFDAFISKPPQFDESILKGPPNPLPSIDGFDLTPAARMIDTDQYKRGDNPDTTLNQRVGLAEYANPNFFGEVSALFYHIAKKTRPYPKLEDAEKGYDLIPDPKDKEKKRKIARQYYYRKIDEENRYKLATVGFLKDHVTKYVPGSVDSLTPFLDEAVYDDYAKLLMPKAVSYSAAVLKYFFRGNLYVNLLVPSVDEVTFNFGNHNDTGRDIDKVAILIQNKSKVNGVIEPVGKGKITLIVSYTNAITGETVYRHGGTGDLETNQIPPFGDSTFLGVLFTLGEPIRTEIARDITYYLSFKGELGEEKEAVIGKVIKGPSISLVYPDRGIEDEVVRIVVDDLPDIKEPFPLKTQDISFNHSVRWPYMAEVVDRRDNEIFVKVPNTAAIVKPGYGGLRVRKIVESGETEETIFSNPVPFFPIAEGIVKNLGDTPQIVTMKAVKPITGDYQVPDPITFTVPPDASVPIELFTGFTYDAVDAGGIPWIEQDIYTLTPDDIDFEFDIEFQ
jgi:hypothetical protein